MKRLMMLFGFLVLLFVPVLSQDSTVVVPPGELPVDFFDAVNLQKWLGTFALLVACVTFFATLLNGLFKTDKSWIRKAVAWIVALLLALAGKIFGIGFIAELDWIMTLVVAVLAGLGANGLFDIPGLQNALYLIESVLGSVFAKKKLNP